MSKLKMTTNPKPEHCYYCGYRLVLWTMVRKRNGWLHEACYNCGTQICSTRVVDTPLLETSDDYV